MKLVPIQKTMQIKGVLGWRENGRGKKMGEENGVEEVFSLAWMGRKWERKEKGRGKVVGHMPHFPPKFFLPKWGDYKREKSCTKLSNNHFPPHPPIFLPFYFPSSIQAWWGITFSLPFSFLSIFSPPIFFPLPFSLHPSRPLRLGKTQLAISFSIFPCFSSCLSLQK